MGLLILGLAALEALRARKGDHVAWYLGPCKVHCLVAGCCSGAPEVCSVGSFHCRQTTIATDIPNPAPQNQSSHKPSFCLHARGWLADTGSQADPFGCNVQSPKLSCACLFVCSG